MTPKPDKAASIPQVSEAEIQKPPVSKETPRSTQKRQHSDSAAPVRRKIIKPTEIVSPDEDDSDSADTSDEDDVESVGLSDDEDEEEEEDDDDDDEDDSSEEDDSDDDAESVYLSDSDEVEEIHPTTVTRLPAGNRRSKSSRNPSTSVARSRNNGQSQSQTSFVQTRTETTHWMVAQHRSQGASQDVTVARGSRTIRQQTIHQQQQPQNNTSTGQRGELRRGNSLRLNMSFNVDVQFNGLVTGRNLSLAGVRSLPLPRDAQLG
ncbi:hypothetical protein AK830_g1857 [Neonectria ditissima]|uniref:Uncharacterized protein n=1 Tax=Neonectria ditissima TaxID=78410 RepID=A0A0N8H8J0_9HYPO|nr:hypothetical protein AK830_g1857 [Neonectria ditissima]